MKNEFWRLITQLIGWFWRVVRVIEKYAQLTKLKSIVKLDAPLVSPPSEFKGDFFKGITCIALLIPLHFFFFSVLINVFFSHLWLWVITVFFSCRNSEWINRRGPHKCGGQIRHTVTGQR